MSTKKRSPVWNHFAIANPDSAKCDHCSKVIRYSGGCTGNLTRHLKTIHKGVLVEQTLNRIPETLDVPVSDVPYKIIVKRPVNSDRKSSKVNVSSSPSAPQCSQLERRVSIDEGEEEMVVKCWAKKLRRLAPDQKIYAEKIINDMLFEGALGSLTRHGATFLSAPAQIVQSPSWSPETSAIYIADPAGKSDNSSQDDDDQTEYDTLYDERS